MADAHTQLTGVDNAQHRVGSSIRLQLDLQLLRASTDTVAVDLYSPTSSTPIATGEVAGLSAADSVLTAETLRLGAILQVNDPSVSNFRSGQSYLLDGPGFPARMVDVVDVNPTVAPLGVEVAPKLNRVVPIGTALQGTLATYDATPQALPRGRGYRALWKVTLIGGDVVEFWQSFDVVYQPFEIALTRADIDAAWPGVGESLPSTWRQMIPAALDAIMGELDRKELEPDRVRNTRPWKPSAVYHICRAVAAGKLGSSTRWGEVFKSFDTLYKESVTMAFGSVRLWYDATDENARADEEERNAPHFWDAPYDSNGELITDGAES